jgi:hypothetical protein
MIPLKIYNRLRRGVDVAAEVAASREGYRAWIHVQPLIDKQNITEDTWIYDEFIRGYHVRYIEIHEIRWMPYLYGTRAYLKDPSTRIEDIEVATLEELEAVLSRWLSDLSVLHPPEMVRCPDWTPFQWNRPVEDSHHST